MHGGSVAGGTVVGHTQRPGTQAAGRAGARAGAVDPDRLGARGPAEERGPAHPHAGRHRERADDGGLPARLLRGARAGARLLRPLPRRGPDRLRHRLHRRRADLRPSGRGAGPDDRRHRLADLRGRHGLRGRAAGPRAGGDRAALPGGARLLLLLRPAGARHGRRRLRGPADLPHGLGPAAPPDADLHPARLPHRSGQSRTPAGPHRRRRPRPARTGGHRGPGPADVGAVPGRGRARRGADPGGGRRVSLKPPRSAGSTSRRTGASPTRPPRRSRRRPAG
ncbi:hypothetical protein SGPA1_21366 [Streptomyces misionensis JCM 4497]